MKLFKSSMSRFARWGGVLVLELFGLLCGLFVWRATVGTSSYLPMALLALVLLLCVLYGTSGYAIENGQLAIRRPAGRKVFDLRGATVRQDPGAFRGMVRIVANGGFFAFDGFFFSRTLGTVRVHARNKAHGVVLALANGKKLVLSPDQPEAFVAAAQEAGAQRLETVTPAVA